MELKDVINYRNIVIVGDTLNEEKIAYKIKHKLIENGYNTYPVYKEIKDINEVPKIDLIIMCINPIKGIEILKSVDKDFKAVLLQEGSSSENIINYLDKLNKPYINGCMLKAIKYYKEEL